MFKTTFFACFVSFSFLFSLMTFAGEIKYKENTVSGPYTHKNLTLFLVHGEDKVKGKTILTLEEAIDQKKLIMHETGQVNQLFVENVSDVYIFLQSGDIVKGGKQDRVIQWDLLVKPKSGKVPISSFCVEQGRWAKRGKENLKAFNSSKKRVSSKELKLASKSRGRQDAVWSEVAKAQSKLSKVMGKSVQSSYSKSSLQLTLEDKDIEKRSKEYVSVMSGKTSGAKKAIGFAFAINGEFNSADFYGNSELFYKLWPKMLEACSVEAIAEYDKKKPVKEVSLDEVVAWFNEFSEGKETTKDIHDKIKVKVKESKENIMFDTIEKDKEKVPIHRNMIKK